MNETHGAVNALLAKVVAQAEDNDMTSPNWRTMLEQLDTRIRRNAEELALRTVVPKDLRDDYRQEIDTVLLDNMQLATKLSQTESALDKAKAAYKDEIRHSMLLEQKLDEMERRLTGVIKKRVSDSERTREA